MSCPTQAVVGQNLTFTVDTKGKTGAPADATGDVAYSVYEDETTTAILTGTMAKLAGETGFYSEQIAISTANGFERYKTYTVRIKATVSGKSLAQSYSFIAVGTADVSVTTDTELGATDICNLALLEIGATQIADYFDTTANGLLCQVLYPQARNEVLIKVKPNCAREFADLGAELSGSSLPDMAEWEYAFNLPSDCLHLIAQVLESNHEQKYKCAKRQGKLLTNYYSNDDDDSAYIEYIFKQVDASEYDPFLVAAIALKLAIKLVAAKTGDKKGELAGRLIRKYLKIVLPDAIAANQEQEYADDEGSYSWLDARN